METGLAETELRHPGQEGSRLHHHRRWSQETHLRQAQDPVAAGEGLRPVWTRRTLRHRRSRRGHQPGRPDPTDQHHPDEAARLTQDKTEALAAARPSIWKLYNRQSTGLAPIK